MTGPASFWQHLLGHGVYEKDHVRQEALVGTDGVVITIFTGGVQVWRHDIEIPMKYGVETKSPISAPASITRPGIWSSNGTGGMLNNAWFRKRKDLIENYWTHSTGWNPGLHGYSLDRHLAREKNWRNEIIEWLEQEEIDLARSHEYAAFIFNASIGDNTLFKFNGNVRNFGLIDNLPEGSCVEVPVLASKAGFEPLRVGPLPNHLAILNDISARTEELAVEAALEGNSREVFHAICMDPPLTSAVLSLQEIKDMTDELLAKNKDHLPGFDIA